MSTRVCPSCGQQSSETRCSSCKVDTLNARDFAGGAPHAGQLFAGKYQVGERIGSGGMGVVYRAHQLHMDRQVALKVLHRRMASDVSAVQRFYREMKAATRVEHPNTVRIYDFGHTDEGDIFLAMELLHGQTLLSLINREGALDAARAAKIAIQIAKGLGAAHDAGVVHRDLKPENVFLLELYGEADYVKVLDFGVARLSDGRPEDSGPALTTTGQVVGTPYYMSPEQALGEVVDHRSDLYALGVVLYRMITGHVPFRESTPMMVLYQHVHTAPVRPSELVKRDGGTPVSAELEEIVMALLAKSPADRPQTAREVIGLLEATLSGSSTALPRMSASPTIVETQPSPSSTSSASSSALPAASASGRTAQVGEDRESSAGPNKRAPAWWALIAAVAAVIAGVVWWNLREEPPAGATETAGNAATIQAAPSSGALASSATSTKMAEAEAPIVDLDGNAPSGEPPEVATPPGAQVAAAEAAPDVGVAARAAVPEAKPQVLLRSLPPGARVFRGGELLGETPYAIDLSDPAGLKDLELRLDGHSALPVRLEGQVSPEVLLALAPLPPPPMQQNAEAQAGSLPVGNPDGPTDALAGGRPQSKRAGGNKNVSAPDPNADSEGGAGTGGFKRWGKEDGQPAPNPRETSKEDSKRWD